jgi:hypothetical protein
MTFLNKRVFPAFWFGFLILFAGIFLFQSVGRNNGPPVPFLAFRQS